jgi:hypothetical protein
VACWTAFVYDYLYKLRELVIIGDQNAAKKIAAFEDSLERNDIAQLLAFERSAPEGACREFEFISEVELIDFQRLLEDRNRCAHPSLKLEFEVFRPSAELARTHIVNAVMNFLRFPPVQGKQALERVVQTITSEYFPRESAGIRNVLIAGPLGRPRAALVRNVVLTLLKKTIEHKSVVYEKPHPMMLALECVLDMHRQEGEGAVRERVNDLLEQAADSSLSRVVQIVHWCPSVRPFLRSPTIERLREYVSRMPIESFDEGDAFESALDLEALSESAQRRLSSLTRDELAFLCRHWPHQAFLGPLLRLYRESRSWETANKIAESMVSLEQVLSRETLMEVLSIASSNSEVLGSFGFSSVLQAQQRVLKMKEEEWKTLFEAHKVPGVAIPM